MEVPYLYIQSIQGISSVLEENFYDVETNIPCNKTEVDSKTDKFLFIYGFISVLVFFILLSLFTTCYYHCKAFRGFLDNESSTRSSSEEQSTHSNDITRTSSNNDVVSNQCCSNESSFDGLPYRAMTSYYQRTQSIIIENSNGSDNQADLSKISSEEFDDFNASQLEIEDSHISLSETDISNDFSFDDIFSAYKSCPPKSSPRVVIHNTLSGTKSSVSESDASSDSISHDSLSDASSIETPGS